MAGGLCRSPWSRLWRPHSEPVGVCWAYLGAHSDSCEWCCLGLVPGSRTEMRIWVPRAYVGGGPWMHCGGAEAARGRRRAGGRHGQQGLSSLGPSEYRVHLWGVRSRRLGVLFSCCPTRAEGPSRSWLSCISSLAPSRLEKVLRRCDSSLKVGSQGL